MHSACLINNSNTGRNEGPGRRAREGGTEGGPAFFAEVPLPCGPQIPHMTDHLDDGICLWSRRSSLRYLSISLPRSFVRPSVSRARISFDGTDRELGGRGFLPWDWPGPRGVPVPSSQCFPQIERFRAFTPQLALPPLPKASLHSWTRGLCWCWSPLLLLESRSHRFLPSSRGATDR